MHQLKGAAVTEVLRDGPGQPQSVRKRFCGVRRKSRFDVVKERLSIENVYQYYAPFTPSGTRLLTVLRASCT
jgi:hypothetical protein